MPGARVNISEGRLGAHTIVDVPVRHASVCHLPACCQWGVRLCASCLCASRVLCPCCKVGPLQSPPICSSELCPGLAWRDQGQCVRGRCGHAGLRVDPSPSGQTQN